MKKSHQVPFISSTCDIKAQWIDYNGHLNMAYYLVIFDEANDEFWAEIGLGENYQKTTGFTTYARSCKIDYIQEVPAKARCYTKMLLLDLQPKKFMTWQGLYLEDGTKCATAETLMLHIDQNGTRPKVAPFPNSIYANLEEIAHLHFKTDAPEGIGRPVEINRPKL